MEPPEGLAHHYTEADHIKQAVHYWYKAGEQAAQQSANVEAVAYVTKGLTLVLTLPDTPARSEQELALQMLLGPALIATKGYGDPDVESAYVRAQILCGQMGETAQLFRVLRGLQVYYLARGQMQISGKLSKELLSLAQNLHDPVMLVGAHFAVGQTLCFQGDWRQASDHLAQAIAHYKPDQHRFPAWAGGHPGLLSFVYAGWALWARGFVVQARDRTDQARGVAATLSSPFDVCASLGLHAMLAQFQRAVRTALELAEAVITLATKQCVLQWQACGKIVHGWALTMQGQGADVLPSMQQGLNVWLASGTHAFHQYWLALLAEVYDRMSQPDKGLQVLEEALTLVDQTGEGFYEAEIYRLKGELLLQQARPDVPQAERCFRQALTVARRQQGKAWELRAATSLSRLWQQQGKCQEAHNLLAPIYGWFTEGFDTADLQGAKVLLEKLGA